MHKDDQVRLQHMLDAAREAIEFTKSRTRTSLDMDRMLVLSLVKEIEIIGEAANQVSETTREQLLQFLGWISSLCETVWSTPILT
jgi:uncharacterized protein with HEPN domain